MAQVFQIPAFETGQRESTISEFLKFLLDAKSELKQNLASPNDERVQLMRVPLEEHYVDDQGKPAMYQRLESAFYDDAQPLVTLWQLFKRYDRQQLIQFRRLIELEQEGLKGDRHPRQIFDRSPFGIVALIVGTLTVWMTVIKSVTGEDFLAEFKDLVQFNWVAGTIWIVGLFVVLWYILKMFRNHRQVALLSSIQRALVTYLEN